MEKGPSPIKPEHDSDSDNDDDHNDDDQDMYQEINQNGHTRSLNRLYKNGFSGSCAGGFRIRIPTGMPPAQPRSGSKIFGKVGNQKSSPNLNQNPSPNSNFGKKRDGGCY
ncbi:uncharacterized protein HKW66_Vig0086660 [Vigna angularis]|uniref:Uncharacterized protein n=1 Tax=Phaseolus angularis TaxID=3914 RepID=A0A8T0KKD8_PHAAN|nr:uncharacterized protein HKW66_Vig0086660 [Vigna angularis]